MPYARARLLIDAAHAADPEGAERAYADGVERWILRLDPNATPVMRLAARCQHLERWLVPRATYPMDKVGYLQWRKGLYRKQAERAQALLLAAGISAIEAEQVRTWVSKTDPQNNAGTQALEDAACLLFLESEIADFAATHVNYSREKFIDIIRKTWRKMSDQGRALALTIPLPSGISELVHEALS